MYKRRYMFPSPPGTFLLSMFSQLPEELQDRVSVPTGDFSFIYEDHMVLYKNVDICVSVPTGDFSFIYEKHYIANDVLVVKFPSPPGTFLLSIKFTKSNKKG